MGTRTNAGDAYAVYRAAVARTYGLIDPAPDLTGGLEAIHARARAKQARLGRLLAAMGDPHLAAPVVHVGGTSGKGSTSVAIAAVLSAAGYRTLLHTSPYLQVATEKLQVDGELLGAEDFAAGIAAVLAAADRLGEGPIGYPELWMGLVGRTMREQVVDAAVIEVGAGGRLDMTNVVRPAVSVITSVGLDHTETLGPTISEIARQKAGIIKPGTPVVTAVTDPEALAVIRAEAAAQGAALAEVRRPRGERGAGSGERGKGKGERGKGKEGSDKGVGWLEPVRWRDGETGEVYVGGMAGEIQAINGATALAAIRALQRQGWAIGEEAIRAGLAAGRLPGRLETVMERSPERGSETVLNRSPRDGTGTVLEPSPGGGAGAMRVVLDAAHNPQKAAALAQDLARMEGRCVGVVGMLAAKQAREALVELAPALRALVATEPSVLGKPSLPAGELAAIAREVGVGGVEVEPAPGAALGRALALAGEDVVLVTGSLYLIGELRRRWYPDEAMVEQRTPWPQ